MDRPATHPSREELNAYSLGQLPEEEAVAIDSHISKCDPCCETIIKLSSEDTFAGLLREVGRLPTDQTAYHECAPLKLSATQNETPQPLAKHPRYEVLALIGKGGMGDVYQARHRKMERTVALKVINRGLVRKPEAIDRFHREVKAAAQLSHPNIVTAYDADHAGDFHFMVMEYVDGIDLSQTVKDQGALPVAEASDYIRQAAIGLHHAHERGMVHRDVKPHNLMVTADGIVKILDFGLASLAPDAIPSSDSVLARSDLTAAGTIMGTPDFISPEQANDARQVDIRSDIYSLGVTFYYLLSGRVPFDDGSVMHKLRSHAQVEPAPLNLVRNDMPEELATIVSKMMAKDPDDRYLTPKEVADALETFLLTWQSDEASSQKQSLLVNGRSVKSDVKEPSGVEARQNWLIVLATVVMVGCLAAGLNYISNIGGVRVEATGPESLGTLGTHPLTIVDTSGKKPLGGTTSTHQDDVSGITTHSFKSANGRYSITLNGDVLTVNGEKHTLKNPTDTIRIVDDRVEIKQIAEIPQNSDQKQPSDRRSNPNVSRIESTFDSQDDAGTSRVQKLLSVSTMGKTAFEGNGTYFASAQLSQDAKTALVKSGAIIQMWNLETGKLSSIAEFGGQGGVVGFVPKTKLAWHAGSGVELWDIGTSVQTDLAIPHLTGPAESPVMPPAFSEDGMLLATQSDVGKFRLWNLETQQPLCSAIEAGTLFFAMKFSPDGKWLFTEDESGWCIWDVATQKLTAGPLRDNKSERNTPLSISPDSSCIVTIEGELPECEIVFRIAQGQTWRELQRIPVRQPVAQSAWIDSQHLAVVVGNRNQTYGLKVISVDELEVQDYGQLRTFNKITIAPDRQHFMVSTYAAATCWKLGRKEQLWKVGTSAAGRSYDVHFGTDWVLLHEKGATTGARPAIVRSLKNGNEFFRKKDAIATAVNGANICLVDATGIEVSRINPDKTTTSE